MIHVLPVCVFPENQTHIHTSSVHVEPDLFTLT